jgi:hypothetical protein
MWNAHDDMEDSWLQLQKACVELATTRCAVSSVGVLRAVNCWNYQADRMRLLLLGSAFQEWAEFLEWLFSGD